MTNSDNLELYRDLATDTVYVLAGRDKCGTWTWKPRDPEDVVTMGKWEFWVARSKERIVRVKYGE